jgi:hypothetical protein
MARIECSIASQVSSVCYCGGVNRNLACRGPGIPGLGG